MCRNEEMLIQQGEEGIGTGDFKLSKQAPRGSSDRLSLHPRIKTGHSRASN